MVGAVVVDLRAEADLGVAGSVVRADGYLVSGAVDLRDVVAVCFVGPVAGDFSDYRMRSNCQRVDAASILSPFS